MLDNTPNQPSRFKTKSWVEINDTSRKTFNKDNQVIFKTSKCRSSLCNYSNAFILAKGTITVPAAKAAAPKNANKKATFKNCAPFTNCIRRINNMQVYDPHDIDTVMSMYI